MNNINTSHIKFNENYIGKEMIILISHDTKTSQFYLPENWTVTQGNKILENAFKIIIDQFKPKTFFLELYTPEDFAKLPSSKASATEVLKELRERFKEGKSFTGIVTKDLAIIEIKDS